MTAVLQGVAAVSILRTSQVSCCLTSLTSRQFDFSPVALVKYLYYSSAIHGNSTNELTHLYGATFLLLNQQVSASETLISEHLSSLLIG